MRSVGITLVGGFLGSGKTTLLQRLVRSPIVAPRLAILVNELGALGLDQELIQAHIQTPALHIQQLTSGCLCCTLQGALPEALVALAEATTPPPERIVIEASGVSSTSELSYAISALGSEYPFRLDAVVVLVDAYNAQRAFQEHPALFIDQLRSADLVVLNKKDLLPNVQEQQNLQKWIAPLAPRATFVWTQHAEVDPTLLLGLHSLVSPSADVARPSRETSHTSATAHQLTAISILLQHPLQWDALEEQLGSLVAGVFRTKGIVDLCVNDHCQTAVVQSVGDWIDYEWVDNASALARSPRRMVFIGTQLHEAELVEKLEACR